MDFFLQHEPSSETHSAHCQLGNDPDAVRSGIRASWLSRLGNGRLGVVTLAGTTVGRGSSRCCLVGGLGSVVGGIAGSRLGLGLYVGFSGGSGISSGGVTRAGRLVGGSLSASRAVGLRLSSTGGATWVAVIGRGSRRLGDIEGFAGTRVSLAFEGASGITGSFGRLVAEGSGLDTNGGNTGEVIVAVSGLAFGTRAADDYVGAQGIASAVSTVGLSADKGASLLAISIQSTVSGIHFTKFPV